MNNAAKGSALAASVLATAAASVVLPLPARDMVPGRWSATVSLDSSCASA